MLRIAVIASLALTSAAFALGPRSQVNVTGSYSSNWDDVKLVQEGDQVTGTYVCCGGGTIQGRVVDSKLRYEWKGFNGTWGLGTWTVDPDKLDGTWGSGQNAVSGGRWDLVRKTAKAQTQNASINFNISGSYSSNWEDVKLVQDGSRVTGTYVCCGGGTIEGRIEGRTLRYTWRQPTGWGQGVWTLDPNKLDGTWGNGQNESSGGRWDLARKTPKTQMAN